MIYKTINNYTTLFWCFLSVYSVSIDDFGAIPNNNTEYASYQNNIAIENALKSNSTSITIPGDNTYYITSVYAENIFDKCLHVDGNITLYDNISSWKSSDGSHYDNGLTFIDSANITILGNGWLDGQGYVWWSSAFKNNLSYSRPNLLAMGRCENIKISYIHFLNSPQYHLWLYDMYELVIDTIYVEVMENQIRLFPLNTDGIDVSGQKISIVNSFIRNFDDAIVIKPLNNQHKYNCSKDIYINNIESHLGVGMSIGSVSPSDNYNCIKDVLFDTITMHYPVKSIYIKTNHGHNGYGIISNITYQNMVIYSPIWYNIYIGPQQQKEPDGSGDGCMLYPLNSDCPTQSRVSIENILLKNITTYSGVLKIGGVIRCNETNPCNNIVFEDVNHYPLPTFYICEHLENGRIENCLI